MIKMGPRRLLISENTIPVFISEVKKRDCIWNSQHESYNDRYETMVAWKEIAKIMDQPEDVLRAKWKNLRDLFKREMKKWKKVDSLEKYKGKWKFFSSMWFIHRPGGVVINEFLEDSNEEYIEDDDDDDNPLQNFVKCEPPDNNEEEEEVFVEVDQVDPPVPNKKKKREEDTDFDMMFLKSLTPYFRQLDPMRKLIVRSKMQDILINEIAAQQCQTNKNNISNNT